MTARARSELPTLPPRLNACGSKKAIRSLLFGGELAAGSLFGSVFPGEPFVDAFNDLGVDVGNFGNHDFDYGVEHTRDLIDRAEFPWISSNLTTQGGNPISEDGTMFQSKSGDLNVGFVSLTADLDRTVAAKDVVVGDFVEAARGDVDRLRAQDVDAISSYLQQAFTTQFMRQGGVDGGVAERMPDVL